VLGDEDGAGAELWAMAQLGTPMAVRVAAASPGFRPRSVRACPGRVDRPS
jgi:hypothetical protein